MFISLLFILVHGGDDGFEGGEQEVVPLDLANPGGSCPSEVFLEAFLLVEDRERELVRVVPQKVNGTYFAEHFAH